MPQNSVRVHISDIPGFEDELKRLVNQLDEKHSVDYDNKPYKKSALYREWHRKHEQRKEYAHSVLGIPFVYPPCWFMLMSRLYDVLHFGLFGEQWKAIILEERDKIMWTGTIWRQSFRLISCVFARWEPLLTTSAQRVICMHFWINIQRFMECMSIYSNCIFRKGSTIHPSFVCVACIQICFSQIT
eukprot:241091_1